MGQTSRDHDEAIEIFGENSHFDSISINGMTFKCRVTGTREEDGRKVEDLRVFLEFDDGEIDPDFDGTGVRPLKEIDELSLKEGLRAAGYAFEENRHFDRIVFGGNEFKCEVLSACVEPRLIAYKKDHKTKTNGLVRERLKVTGGLVHSMETHRTRKAKVKEIRAVLEKAVAHDRDIEVIEKEVEREPDQHPIRQVIVRLCEEEGAGMDGQKEMRAAVQAILDSGDHIFLREVDEPRKLSDGRDARSIVVHQYVGTGLAKAA